VLRFSSVCVQTITHRAAQLRLPATTTTSLGSGASRLVASTCCSSRFRLRDLWSWYDRSELRAGELLGLKLFAASLNDSTNYFLDCHERRVRLGDDLDRPFSTVCSLDRRAIARGIEDVPWLV